MLFPCNFFCRYSRYLQKDDPEGSRQEKCCPLRIRCRDTSGEKSDKHHHCNNEKDNGKHLTPDIGTVSDNSSANSAEPERVEIMNTGVVAGILQKMQETSYQKCRAKHPDERVVPQKLQVRDIGERVAEHP